MLKHFHVGFVTGSLPRGLPKDRIEDLKQRGILTDPKEKNTACGCREFFTGCVLKFSDNLLTMKSITFPDFLRLLVFLNDYDYYTNSYI